MHVSQKGGAYVEDPDIRLLLENYCFRHQSAPQHYFVTSSKQFSAKVKQVYEESLRIKLLEYKNTPDHSDLTTELGKLVEKVGTARMKMATEMSW